MNLSQTGHNLYLALGEHFGRSSQNPGFAIVNVADPAAATVAALWFDPALRGGAGVVDKRRPFEAGRFSNPTMNGKPRAYNNAVLDGDLLYVTADYCGMEVLNIAQPARISLVSRWNPWRCETSGWNWFSSPGHANEIAFDRKSKRVFIATGMSDLHVVSVANPSAPELCVVYGGPTNNIGTWGVSVHENRVYLSYICTLGVPFPSNWTGGKVLTFK